MKPIVTLVIILWTVVLTACAAERAPSSQMVSQITAIPTETASPTPLPTKTPVPTATPLPTETSTPTPTETATMLPTATNTLLPPSAIPTVVSPTITPTATPLPSNIPTFIPTVVEPTATFTPEGIIVDGTSRTVRVGLHGRNDADFTELDYQVIREAKIETMKMMSLTKPEVFARIRQENPGIEFIVRLYDDRLNEQGHPTPEEFAQKIIPIMTSLQPYATKFEVGNEPNHYKRYEGWGPEDADAQNFNTWFIAVYDLLKAAHPWAELGFPALGTPDEVHRDKAWLTYNQAAINKADWLGVHCYWQTSPDGTTTMFDEDHGLCFQYYHARFPDKPIELTEFDNDNIFYNLPLINEAEMEAQYVAYYQELFKYPYIRSASSYILSSPYAEWESFVWRTEAGHIKPVVTAVGSMTRPPLQ